MRRIRATLLAAAVIAAASGCGPLRGVDPDEFPAWTGGIEVMLADTLVAEGERVEGVYFKAPRGGPFAILWLDSMGRISADISGKARFEHLGFWMPVLDPLDPGGQIVAMDQIRPERRASARFVIEPDARDWQGFPLVADPGRKVTDPAEWKRFRALGARFAATDVESAELALYGGLRPLPFDIMPQRETLRLRDETWRRRLEANRKSPAPVHRIRPNCPADPAERKTIRRLLRDRALALRSAGAVGVSLARDPALAPRSGGIDFCLCPGCSARLVKELRKRYTKTEVLGTAWGTPVAAWEGLVPPGLDECIRRSAAGRVNLAPWCEHRSETDSSWVDSLSWMRSFIREHSERLPVGFVGGHPPDPASGYDWDKMLSWPDWAAPPIDELTSLLARAANRRGVPLLGIVDEPGDGGRAQVWRAVLAGRSGLIISGRAASDDLVWKEARFAEGGIGELIASAEPCDSRVGLFWSQRSLQVRSALGNRPEGSVRVWLAHLERLGVTPRMMTPVDLELARRSGLRAIILPEAVSLSRREAALLRDFARAGGLIVADRSCGLYDRLGRERKGKGALDDLFGIGRTAEGPVSADRPLAEIPGKDRVGFLDGVDLTRLTVSEANVRAVTAYPRARARDAACMLLRDAGKGRAAYLNVAIADPASADEGALVANLLELAGVGRELPVWSGGEVVPGCLRRRYRLGPVEIVVIWAPKIRSPRIGVVGLKRSLFVYDATDGVFLGQTSRPQIEIRSSRPVVLACFDQQAPAVDLALVDRRGRIEYRASAEAPTEPLDRVYRLEVLAPDDRVIPAYSRTLFARAGKASGTFTPARNEPVGPWSVRVTDVATGNAVTATFLKRDVRFETLFPPGSIPVRKRRRRR